MDVMDFIPERLPNQVAIAAIIGGFGFSGAAALTNPETPRSVLGHNTAVDVCDSQLYFLGKQATAKQLDATACGQFKGSFDFQETTVNVYEPANSDSEGTLLSQSTSSTYRVPSPHTFRAANYITSKDIQNDNSRDRQTNLIIGA